jgi:hypothetical protein
VRRHGVVPPFELDGRALAVVPAPDGAPDAPVPTGAQS